MLRKNIKPILINVLISYILIELICYVFVKTNYIPANLPSFQVREAELPPVADINPVWGVWHPANTTTEMSIGDCFKITYHANSFGCRDVERTMKDDTNRVIVLGDSFMEGLGVEENERLTNVLEKQTGRKFLNFACSGNFSTLQEYLVYDSLASKFSHNEVWLGILPDNDFNDDDYDLGKQVWYYNLRYKPYWVGKYPNYEMTYMQKTLNDSYFTPQKIEEEKGKFSNKVHQVFKAFTVWYNIYVYYQVKKVGLELARSTNYSGYYDYTPNQLNTLKFSLEKLTRVAKNKKIRIFLLPAVYDFVRYEKEGGKGNTKLFNDLETFCKEKNIRIDDLLPQFYLEHPKDFTKYYITCDRHWNIEGNKYVADLLNKK